MITIKEIQDSSLEMKPWLISLRRDLHQHPEEGLKEYYTSAKIIELLTAFGIEITQFPGQTSVVGTLYGKASGKTVALRADMDALHMAEPIGKPYASLNPGWMHACGHDAHVAILLGCAKYLSTIKDKLHGNVKFLFQPAEESVGGAQRMVEAGCMENPHADYVFGLHVMPNVPCGSIETRFGPLNGASDSIHITLKGTSSHGAYPERGVDAIVMAGQVITALQTISSRNVSALDSIVLSIGTIHGGEASNIICDSVKIRLTLRTLRPETRSYAKNRIKEIVTGIASAMGGEAEIEIIEGYWALINDDQMVTKVINVTKELFGEDKLLHKDQPSLGVEDFSYFLNCAQGAFYHLGCANESLGIHSPLHSTTFDIDEDCLPLGVMMQSSLVIKILQEDI